MIAVHLTDRHMIGKGDADGEAITEWMRDQHVDVEWIVLPSILQINKDAVITREYLHDEHGTLLRDENGARTAPVRYECTPAPLPPLTGKTRVERS